MSMLQIIVGIVIELIVLGAYIIVGSFFIWMIVDAAKQDRFWWIVIILGVPVVGAAAYYLTEKKHEYAKAPVHHIHESETESQHETTPKKHKPNHGKATNLLIRKGEEKIEEPKEEAMKESEEKVEAGEIDEVDKKEAV